MDTSALHARMAGRLQDELAKRTFTLDASFVPEAAALLSCLPPGQSRTALVLQEAHLDDGASTPTVIGKVALLGIPDVSVALAAGGDSQGNWLTLAIRGMPETWTLSPAISNIPKYWARNPNEFGLGLRDSFLNDLPWTASQIVFSTRDDPTAQLKTGLNLSGSVGLDNVLAGGLFAGLLRWIDGTAPPRFSGTIRWPDGQVPVIDLTAPLGGLGAFHIGSSFRSTGASIRMRTDSLALADDGTPVSVLELAVTTSFGQPKQLELTLATELIAAPGEFVFRGQSDNKSFSVSNVLTDMKAAVGVDAHFGDLPDWFPPISNLYLKEVDLAFAAGAASAPSPLGVAVVIALPDDTNWPTPIPRLSLTAFAFRGSYLFGGAPGPWDIRLDFRLKIGTGKLFIHLTAELPELLFAGELDPDSDPIHLTDALRSFLDVSSLPEIDIQALSASIDARNKTFSLRGALATDWKLGLGKNVDFGLKSIEAGIHAGVGVTPSGTLRGQATLGPATFDATLAVPAVDFTVSGKIPSIKLGELIDNLCHDIIGDLGTEFDFTLTDSQVAITKSGGDYLFLLRTTVAGFGTLFFEIQRNGGTWGAAVGVDLGDLHAIGAIPGLSSLDIVDIHLDRMVLVLSSVELKGGFTFPDLPALAGPPSASKVGIPVAFGSSVVGLNVFAKFMFGDPKSTQSVALQKFYERFKFEPVEMDVGLQLGRKNNAFTVLLGGACEFRVGDIDIHGLLAFRYSLETIELLLRVTLFEMPAPYSKAGDKLQFGGQFELEENGIEASASMVGKWSNAFGIEGFTITEAGIAIGIDWELLPTIGLLGAFTAGPVDGSLGFVINTVEPLQSGAFGSLGDTSLEDIFRGLLGSNLPGFAQAMEIIGGIPDVQIRGTGGFDLDANLASAFDGGDPSVLAPVFQQHQERLGATGDLTFVITAKPGQKWYITDVANNQTHWEIDMDGDKLHVRREAQFYFVPVNTSIGTITLTSEVRVSGQLDLHGWTCRSDIHIALGSGIWIDEHMDPIDLVVLRVDRANADTSGSGPHLSLCTYQQGAKQPHFAVSCNLTLVGMPLLDVLLKVSAKGFLFDTENPLQLGLIGIQRLHLEFKQSPAYFQGNGVLSVGIGAIDLGALGNIPGILALDGDLQIGMNGTQASATLGLSFVVFGATIQVATLNLMQQDLSKASGGGNVAAAEFANSIVADRPEAWLTLVNAGHITTQAGTRYTPAEVGRVLQQSYERTPEEIGELTRVHMNYGDDEVSSAVGGAARR